MVAMFPDKLPNCYVSCTRISALSDPKSVDWMQDQTMLVAQASREDRLSCPIMIRMPQAKQLRELANTRILKVRVKAGLQRQTTRLVRKYPRKMKLLPTSRLRQNTSIVLMSQELPLRSRQRQARCSDTQQMLAAMPQIWLESTSVQSLTSSRQGRGVAAVLIRKMMMEKMQQALPMWQQLKFLRWMEAKLSCQERWQDWVKRMSRLRRGSRVAQKVQPIQGPRGKVSLFTVAAAFFSQSDSEEEAVELCPGDLVGLLCDSEELAVLMRLKIIYNFIFQTTIFYLYQGRLFYFTGHKTNISAANLTRRKDLLFRFNQSAPYFF